MIEDKIQFILFLIFVCYPKVAFGELSSYSFPENFILGVGSSAYQVEGAWNTSGKGENIWDHYLHADPNRVIDKSNGDVTCNAYHKYEEDIQLVKRLGVNFYKLSISWSRILPLARKGTEVNKDGINYYNKLIDGLLANGIEPHVVIYHFDTPQVLEDYGGWLNGSIIDDYTYYARILFNAYGNRVKYWITMNEFTQFCERGYSEGEMAPFKKMAGVGGYQCTHNALLAHAKVYKIYSEEFKPIQKGRLGITIDSIWAEPKTNSKEDKLAAEMYMQFNFGLYAHPIIIGDYPYIVKTRIDTLSYIQGYNASRLPKFAEEEIKLVRGSYDFIGLNQYTTVLASWSSKPFHRPSKAQDCGVETIQDPSWKLAAENWLAEVPWGFKNVLIWIKERYSNPPILITENGWATKYVNLKDDDRIDYLQKYISELLVAIHDYGCNVFGYAIWCLMDNFQWHSGFVNRYGLVSVDFKDPNRTRTPKKSFGMYQKIIKNRRL